MVVETARREEDGDAGNWLMKTLNLVDILTLHNGGSYPPGHMGRSSDCSSPEPARSRHRPPRSSNALRIFVSLGVLLCRLLHTSKDCSGKGNGGGKLCLTSG